MAIDLETLLAPIPGDHPAGVNLRDVVEFDGMVRARRRGHDKAAGIVPGADADDDWRTLERLATDALTNRSKDLQLAIWLLEAETHLNGFGGAAAGLKLLREVITRYWASLHPLPDDDDEPLALRLSIMEWLDLKLPSLLEVLPLTDAAPPYSLVHYEASQATGPRKEILVEEGWPTEEQFEAGMDAATDAGLAAVHDAIMACRIELRLLADAADGAFVEKRIGPDGKERAQPMLSLERPAEVLERCRRLVEAAVTRRALRGPSATSVELS
jgi:type VI secretion system protein ImpA